MIKKKVIFQLTLQQVLCRCLEHARFLQLSLMTQTQRIPDQARQLADSRPTSVLVAMLLVYFPAVATSIARSGRESPQDH